MLYFGLTIQATVLQRSEIPEGLVNYPVEYHVVYDRSTRNGIAGRLRDKYKKKGIRGTNDDLNISSHARNKRQ